VGVVFLSAAPAYGESSQTGKSGAQLTTLPVVGPKRIRYTAPEYPEKALLQRLSGFVTIEFVVNTKGEPTKLRVVDAQNAEIFERALLKAAKRWRYRPLVVDNVPRETPMRAIVRFDTLT
jgi:TonB family protein